MPLLWPFLIVSQTSRRPISAHNQPKITREWSKNRKNPFCNCPPPPVVFMFKISSFFLNSDILFVVEAVERNEVIATGFDVLVGEVFHVLNEVSQEYCQASENTSSILPLIGNVKNNDEIALICEFSAGNKNIDGGKGSFKENQLPSKSLQRPSIQQRLSGNFWR